jgi:hypothetical protein
MHPDVYHLMFLYGFQDITYHDLGINSPIVLVGKKLVKLTFGTRLQLEHVVLKGYGVVQK